jgi:glycosyltransferase involved in cell wall biosynthesis
MRYSILLATLGRTAELDVFFSSLDRQTHRDFEVIVIDQNPGEVLTPILDEWRSRFPIRQMRSAPGHSRAFNQGLTQVRGDIVAFPDDDCWYGPNLLEQVQSQFSANPHWSGITGREVVEPGFTCGGRWDKRGGPITRNNVFRRAICFSMFLRSEVAVNYKFDESLGVGARTKWGAGEETDYLLRIVQDGHRIEYLPKIAVWHQGRSGPCTAETYARVRSYARGMGRVLRKHNYPLWMVVPHWIRPMGGALLSLAGCRLEKSLLHWSNLTGRVEGWLSACPGQNSDQTAEDRAPGLHTPVPARLSSSKDVS